MIILAFPGMGKTPLAKKNGKYFDLDFGYFRDAMKVHKDEESELIPKFIRLAKHYENDGFVVLANEPKLMQFTRISHVYLPADISFSAKKMGVRKDTITEWIDDWERQARKYGVPVSRIRVGLDHYLK